MGGRVGLRAGLDIGGTSTVAVLLDTEGAPLAHHTARSGRGPTAVVDVAVAAVGRLCDAAGVSPAALRGVGVGLPGTVVDGRVRNAVNLGIAELDMAGALGDRLGAPVFVENDVDAAALGAHHVLAAAGDAPRSLAYLNLGTGLACGVVTGGRLWRGAAGAAGEVGHVPVDPDGAPCPCGQRGCLETVASGSAVARMWPAPDAPPPVALFAAAAQGDPAARAVRERVLAGVAAAVRLVALTFDPERVVLGGGLTALGRPLLSGVREALTELARGSPFLASLDLPDRLGLVPRPAEVGALGAALLTGVLAAR